MIHLTLRTDRKDRNRSIDRKKNDENDIHKNTKTNKAKMNKVYEMNEEKKKLLRQRREKAIQNAKDRETEKVNTQAVLHTCGGVNKTSKTNQNTNMINDATENKEGTDEISLFSCPPSNSSNLLE